MALSQKPAAYLLCALLAAGCSHSSAAQRPTAASPASAAPKVELVTIHKNNVAVGVEQRLQFARVSGLPDQSLTDKVNARLRSGAEDTLEAFEKDLDNPDPAGSGVTPATTMMTSKATVGLFNSRVVAVRYAFSVNGADLGAVPTRTVVPVVVDLDTGSELTAKELLSSRVTSAQGARDFTRLLAKAGPGGRLCDETPPDARDFTPADIVGGTGGDGVVGVFPTAKSVEFSLGLWKLGYPMVCNPQTISIPYADLRGFLAPVLPS